MPETSDARERHLANLRELWTVGIPFNRVLGVEVVQLRPGHAVLAVPFRQELIGDPMRPALHGGVLSALMDACGGVAVWSCIGENDRVSTIDLRVDYLRPGPAERIVSIADVLRVGNRVGVASIRTHPESDPDLVIAEGKGVYSIRRVEEP